MDTVSSGLLIVWTTPGAYIIAALIALGLLRRRRRVVQAVVVAVWLH